MEVYFKSTSMRVEEMFVLDRTQAYFQTPITLHQVEVVLNIPLIQFYYLSIDI